MSPLQRIRNILLTPISEWTVIVAENDTPASLFRRYVIPLILIGGVAAFIGYGIIGLDTGFYKIQGVRWGVWFATRQILSGIIGYFVATYVIDLLAPNFSSERNMGRSAQLVAYASTPSWLSAVFMAIPALGFMGLLGLYGIYLFYTGLPVMKKTPEDKRVVYMVISALVTIIVSIAAQSLISMILNPIMGDPYEGSINELKKFFDR